LAGGRARADDVVACAAIRDAVAAVRVDRVIARTTDQRVSRQRSIDCVISATTIHEGSAVLETSGKHRNIIVTSPCIDCIPCWISEEIIKCLKSNLVSRLRINYVISILSANINQYVAENLWFYI
jgi:ABC-type glucose/galactose transport system permease subunit